MRAMSWETLLTCCFTPHRLFSFLERAGSSQTQGLPATSKPAATMRKQPRTRRRYRRPQSSHLQRTRRRECIHRIETPHRNKQRAAPQDGSLQSSYGPAYAFDAW